ncbi:MAG: PAS domain S-box protein [Thermoanaerobaculum sp.]
MQWFSAASAAFLGVTPPELVLFLVILGVVSLVWALVLRYALNRRTRQLLASEARFRSLVERLPVGVYRARVDGRMVACNPAAASLLGFASPEAMTAVPAWKLYWHPQDRERFIAALREKRHLPAHEVLLRRADGTPLWVLRDAALVVEGGEELVEGVIMDWSEVRRAQEEVRLLAHALRSISECVSITDAENRILFVNDAFCRTYGYTEGELLGQNIALVRLPEDPSPSLETTLQETLAGGFRGEVWNHTRECRRILVRLSTSLVRDENGKPLALIGVARDITAEREREDALRETQKLETLGRLAGGIAHDFNNVLQAQMALVQLLQGKSRSVPGLQSLASQLEALVHRGAALTRKLLLFARRGEEHLSPLDLNAFVSEELPFLKRLLPENVALVEERSPGPLVVHADWHQLGQVLMNLVVNAQDAMPDGGTLWVRTLGNEEWAGLEVEDTGTGIPEEIRPKIFEPFFSTKPAGRGTGLGLSVVHGIVARHGGRVEVESRVGEGSRFRVWFPRATVEVETQPPRREAPAPPRGQGQPLLLVEDEPLAREALATALADLGYEVTPVASAEEALALPDLERFSVLVTDYGLPGVTGLELAARLLSRAPHLKVLLMSGYGPEMATINGRFQVAAAFLQKPFTLAELATTLAKLTVQ